MLFDTSPWTDYEVRAFNGAEQVLQDYPDHVAEIASILKTFRMSHTEIMEAGGCKHRITKRIEASLRAVGYTMEQKLSNDSHKIDASLVKKIGVAGACPILAIGLTENQLYEDSPDPLAEIFVMAGGLAAQRPELNLISL
jgi:hypothetical protein